MHTFATTNEQDVTAASEKGYLLCTCGRIRQAARLSSRIYDKALKPSGLNIGQWGMLSRLRSGTSFTLGELAEELDMDRTTLTRNLKPLQRDSLIEMATGTDRRTSNLRITAKGIKTWETALPLWKAAQAEMARLFGRDMRKQLHVSLDHAIAAMEEHGRA